MKIYLFILLALLISCSDITPLQSNKVYSIEEVKTVGIKIKGKFKTNFPDATESSWGFYKGREVALLIYPSVDLANTKGKIAGKEQSEFTKILEKNIAHGPKVEKTKCRGLKSNRYGFNNKMNIKSDSDIGLGNILILNKLKIFENNINLRVTDAICVRREPLYSDFVIYGNLVILAEPLMKDYGQGQMIETSEKTIKFINEIIEKLP